MRSYLRPLLPLFIALAAAYWVALFVSTHMPVENVDLGISNIDKLAHCGAYAILAFSIGSVLALWRGYQTRQPIWIWTLTIAYGAIDEATQHFVPSRSPDVIDLACDAAGATLGLVLVHVCVVGLRSWRSWRIAAAPEASV